MESSKYGILILTLLTSTSIFSQIVTNEKPEKEENEKKQEQPTKVESIKPSQVGENDNQTMVYFNTNWSNTSRSLAENEGLFAQDIGERANEVNANFWSFGVGFRSDLNKFLRLSAGLGLVRNGEKYSFIGSDSSFNYTTKYSYVSMPLVLEFVYGKDLKLSIGGGLMPQMMLRYNQEQEWENSVNAKSTNTVKLRGTDQNFNPFLVSALVNAGVQYKFGENWSIYFTPEARFQLSSTYAKNYAYIQKAMSIGFNLGLNFHL